MVLTVQVSNLSVGKGFFSPPPQHPDWLWGPLSLLFTAYWGSSLGVKWPGDDVDHSFLFSYEVKNECNYSSTCPVCVHGMGRTAEHSHCTFGLVCSVSHFKWQWLCRWLSQGLIWRAIANVWQSGTRQFRLCITSAVKWDPHVASWCTMSNLSCILVSGCVVFFSSLTSHGMNLFFTTTNLSTSQVVSHCQSKSSPLYIVAQCVYSCSLLAMLSVT